MATLRNFYKPLFLTSHYLRSYRVFYFMEIWKDIKGYEGLYQVSNLGRVKSLDRIEINSKGSKRRIKNRILKPSNKKGYLQVNIYKNCKVETFAIHVLVSIAFLNHKPCGMRKVINHIDFDKSNNRVENLEIVTQRENSSHRKRKSSSKYTGVYWNKERKKWQSQITIKGKVHNLGSFENEFDAHLAYQKKLSVTP